MTEQVPTALVVADDEVARNMLMFALRNEGVVCEHAIDGDDALAACDQHAFDVVITDLHMPNKNGHSLVTELLERERRPMIVVHTAVLEPRLTKDLMGRGVDDIVYKPTDYRVLAVKTRCLVARRNRLLEKLATVMSDLGWNHKN